MEYNGGAIVAMTGKNCFAIASDSRLGIQGQTVSTKFQKVFKMHDRLFIGMSGLASDVQTLCVAHMRDSPLWGLTSTKLYAGPSSSSTA